MDRKNRALVVLIYEIRETIKRLKDDDEDKHSKSIQGLEVGMKLAEEALEESSENLDGGNAKSLCEFYDRIYANVSAALLRFKNSDFINTKLRDFSKFFLGDIKAGSFLLKEPGKFHLPRMSYFFAL